MEEAIEWLKKCPNPMPEESEIEIRPLFEADDFGEAFTPELRGQEELVWARASLQRATVQPYIFFGGRCEEALQYYQNTLDAKVVTVMRYHESPEPVPDGRLAPGFENKIMHSEIKIGTMSIMGSDGCSEADANFSGFRLVLAVPNVEAAELAFHALSHGGQVDMPLMETFWSPRFGMLTDKIGVGWMVMVPQGRPA